VIQDDVSDQDPDPRNGRFSQSASGPSRQLLKIGDLRIDFSRELTSPAFLVFTHCRSTGSDDGYVIFSPLAERLSEVPGLSRLRFILRMQTLTKGIVQSDKLPIHAIPVKELSGGHFWHFEATGTRPGDGVGERIIGAFQSFEVEPCKDRIPD